MEDTFFELSRWLTHRLSGSERLYCWLSGEHSDFSRFNHGKIRQAGHVEQANLRLQFADGQRQAVAEYPLTLHLREDQAALDAVLSQLRESLCDLPDDPHLYFNEEPTITRGIRTETLPTGAEMAAEVVKASAQKDLVGLLSSGIIFRGFSSSLGHQGWHQTTSFLLDSSLYLQKDQAIKVNYAGVHWEPSQVHHRIAEAARKLELLAHPVHTLHPGSYRAYLAPAANAEIFGTLGWGGFSQKALRTRQSALVRLEQGERLFSSKVTLSENFRDGLAPSFQAEGFLRPAQIPLIEGGRFAGTLVSPRTAREYGIPTNGANAAESPEALDMAPGELPSEEILRTLGTGLLIGNLWYLNYSDRGAGRMTGMTRFATFWVENGEIVGPTPVMRFDDSIYDLFGDRLEALSSDREFFPDSTTYGERQTTSMRLPGALVSRFDFTLLKCLHGHFFLSITTGSSSPIASSLGRH